jgi:tetratricopeptide (TPR) repeat protein
MKEPTTPGEVMAEGKLLRADPQAYLRLVNERIRENPKNSHAYFDRHSAWMHLGEPQRALDDLNRVIELDPDVISYMSRGEVHRHLGQYDKALADFGRGEAIDPINWEKGIVFGLLFQADCHAQLGDEEKALDSCARLPDDFWTPGLFGAPAGNKSDIADKLRRVAADARRTQS